MRIPTTTSHRESPRAASSPEGSRYDSDPGERRSGPGRRLPPRARGSRPLLSRPQFLSRGRLGTGETQPRGTGGLWEGTSPGSVGRGTRRVPGASEAAGRAERRGDALFRRVTTATPESADFVLGAAKHRPCWNWHTSPTDSPVCCLLALAPWGRGTEGQRLEKPPWIPARLDMNQGVWPQSPPLSPPRGMWVFSVSAPSGVLGRRLDPTPSCPSPEGTCPENVISLYLLGQGRS